MEQAIVEILRVVGVYDQARKVVDSDEELAQLFQDDFEKLIGRVVAKEKPITEAASGMGSMGDVI